MNAALIEKLKELAGRDCWDEDEEEGFNACDFSGGNYDAAYRGGAADGASIIAREVLLAIGEEW